MNPVERGQIPVDITNYEKYVSKSLFHNAVDKNGSYNIGKIFKNLANKATTTFHQVQTLFETGKWINDKTVAKAMENKFNQLLSFSENIRSGDEIMDQEFILAGLKQMTAVCKALIKAKVKGTDVQLKMLQDLVVTYGEGIKKNKENFAKLRDENIVGKQEAKVSNRLSTLKAERFNELDKIGPKEGRLEKLEKIDSVNQSKFNRSEKTKDKAEANAEGVRVQRLKDRAIELGKVGKSEGADKAQEFDIVNQGKFNRSEKLKERAEFNSKGVAEQRHKERTVELTKIGKSEGANNPEPFNKIIKAHIPKVTYKDIEHLENALKSLVKVAVKEGVSGATQTMLKELIEGKNSQGEGFEITEKIFDLVEGELIYLKKAIPNEDGSGIIVKDETKYSELKKAYTEAIKAFSRLPGPDREAQAEEKKLAEEKTLAKANKKNERDNIERQRATDMMKANSPEKEVLKEYLTGAKKVEAEENTRIRKEKIKLGTAEFNEDFPATKGKKARTVDDAEEPNISSRSNLKNKAGDLQFSPRSKVQTDPAEIANVRQELKALTKAVDDLVDDARQAGIEGSLGRWMGAGSKDNIKLQELQNERNVSIEDGLVKANELLRLVEKGLIQKGIAKEGHTSDGSGKLFRRPLNDRLRILIDKDYENLRDSYEALRAKVENLSKK